MPKSDALVRYEKAKAAWPGVVVPRAAFDAWLEGRDATRSDELYLACACVRGDTTAIKTFEARYFGPVTAAVSRFGSDTFVDDVKQELRQRLFFGVSGKPKLIEYGGKGGLSQWVRAVATRVALNLKRTRQDERFAPVGDDDGLMDLPFQDDDPELAHMKTMYRAEFKKAFAEGVLQLPPEQRNYLRLYYVDGLGLVQIAKLFGSSAPTVSRRLAEARARVLEGTRTLLSARLKVSSKELESIMRLIESKLSVETLHT